MQDAYRKLEFDRLLERIAAHCRTEQGKKTILSLRMFKNERELESELSYLREAIDAYRSFERFPIAVSSDLEERMGLAERGAVLQPEDFAKIEGDIETSDALSHYFKQVNCASALKEFHERNKGDLAFLKKAIDRVIGPDLSILDGASPELRSIRGAKRRLEETMHKKLGLILAQNKDYLSVPSLTLKNGHYALPVQNAYKRKVPGIVQDVSSSGETSFIEPAALVELGNRMTELNIKEKDEIQRILKALTGEALRKKDEIMGLNRAIGRFDAWGAKAEYALSEKAIVATISAEPLIDIHDARHPLLDPESVVANDFHLDENERAIIISGPNAGGKTVALKTLGLLIMMHHASLPIPAEEGARLSFFKGVYVDIGDSQSLSDNLSTYSGHMKNVGEIIKCAGGKDLVLLDELGTGTSPKEGEAIAYAVVSSLLKKHAFTLVSSHFEGLKAFALSEKGLTNASMLFNEDTLEPTYRLQSGLPGESYGLMAAKRFGLPEETLREAERYLLGHEDLSVSEAIKKLSEATRKNEEGIAKNVKERNVIEEERKRLLSKEVALTMKENAFNERLMEREKELLAEYEAKLDEIIRELKHDGVKLHEAIAAKRRLDDLWKGPETERFSSPIEVGDFVSVPSLGIKGRVKNSENGKIEVVTAKGMTFKTEASLAYKEIRNIQESAELRPSLNPDDAAFKKGVPLELSLIGERAEEAREDLEKYLDDCRIIGYKRVRIVHGFGNGVLRKVVKEYALAHPEFIERSELAGEGEGSGGATVLYLK